MEQTFDCGSDGSAMCTITVDYKYEKGPFDQGEGGKVHIYIDGEMKLTEYTEMCWDCQRRHASRIKALYRWVR